MPTFAVECIYYNRKSELETIAMFDCKGITEGYSRMHDGEGGCRLSIVELADVQHLPFKIIVRRNLSNNSFIKASFKYKCEADAFVDRDASWAGGYSLVVQESLSKTLV